MIGQANNLINKSDMNKVYPQKWECIDLHYNLSKKSTSNQCKNVCKMSNKSSKYNCKLSQANFGELVYDRFPDKKNNLWTIGENYQEKKAFEKKEQEFQFDSRFQSGNLKQVYQREDHKKGKI